ncbi:hypothetical protein SAMN04490248_12921 [Salinihabitans flavidus]|uniref:Uncharacterized protein n=1 Tax=Salinihabitans flavidus TaxID=569882 RepID=A0A1H8VGY3_9RHOB|nr:hypothetical protein [Salinihabitans flavidus]SEP14675.1 hypothetical protein SAMN04490248_12921 [Salinihabitans flavidus]
MVIVVGLIVAIVLIVIFSRPSMRNCRWRRDRSRDTGGQEFHVCAACGATMLCEPGKAPRRCLRPRG